MSPKRVLLSAVYLTASERDLVRSALQAMCDWLEPSKSEMINGASIWAKSHSRRRLAEAIDLFADKPETES